MSDGVPHSVVVLQKYDDSSVVLIELKTFTDASPSENIFVSNPGGLELHSSITRSPTKEQKSVPIGGRLLKRPHLLPEFELAPRVTLMIAIWEEIEE